MKTILIFISLLLHVPLAIAADAQQQQYSSTQFKHWLGAAHIAQASYQSREDLAASLKPLNYQIDLYRQIDGFSVTYALASNHQTKQHLIVVRGTSNIQNAVVDAAFVLINDEISGIDIHQGFLISARDIYQQIKPEIKPGYTINTIGHSLGGAAALIIGIMLDAQGARLGEIITFGQPKVTNISGARHYKHLNVTRLVTPKDIVPLVPPLDPMDLMNLSIFWHLGTEVILYKGNQYAVLEGLDSMMRATSFLNDMPAEEHVTGHFMTSYINNLMGKLEDPRQVKYSSDFTLSDWFKPSATQN